jgi:hypothetical protein
VLSAFHPKFVTDRSRKVLGTLVITRAFLAYMSKVKWRKEFA